MMYKDQDQAYDGFFLNDADHPVIRTWKTLVGLLLCMERPMKLD